MLDPRRLLTFRAVAREGSFSRAAEALALSQPAVSQQVSALERELGTALLVRGRAGTVPTEAGALLLEHAAGVYAGRLHAAVLFEDAARPRRDHAELRRVELGDEPMVAVLAAGHRLSGEREIDVRALADEPWMAPSRDGIVVRACRAAGFEPRLVILTRDTLAVRAIAAAGLAVTLTPMLVARVGLPGIATPALSGDPPRRRLYAVLPPTGAHPHAAGLIAALAAAA